MATTKRVGILTGGGDVPGLNMCLKSLVYRLIDLGYEPIGVRKGWDGLIQYNPSRPIHLQRSLYRADQKHGAAHRPHTRLFPALIAHSTHVASPPSRCRSSCAIKARKPRI